MILPGSRPPGPETEPGLDELMVVPYEGDGDAWDRFVEGAEGATFAHRYGWRGVMEDVMGHPTRYSVATDARGRWHGVLPMARVESSVFGRYLVSMPHLDHGGPVGSPAARWILAESARDRAVAEDVELLELRTRVATATSLQVSHRRRFLEVDLGGGSGRRGTAGDAPTSPTGERVSEEADEEEVHEGTAGLESFVRLYGARLRDRGLPAPPPRFFEAVAEAFGSRVRFVALHRREDPVAALCAFVGADELEIAWSAALPTGPPSAAERLHRAVVLAPAADEEVRRVRLSAENPDSPPGDWWARRWETKEVAAPWLQWRPPARPASDRPLYRAATWLWSHLPRRVAERLAPSLSRPRA